MSKSNLQRGRCSAVTRLSLALIAGTSLLGTGSFAQNSAPANFSSWLSSGTAFLEYEKSEIVRDLPPASSVVGRLDCDSNGSVVTLVNGYDAGAPALLSIGATGEATVIPWRSVPGYTNISMPGAIFAGNGRLYVLAHGEHIQAQDRTSRDPIVLSFDEGGSLVQALALKPEADPLALGVFRSGNILLLSEDRLNGRMRLQVIKPDGTELREIELNESDLLLRAAQMPAAVRGTSAYSPRLLLTMAKFYPAGDNLLLVPLETSGLPILELSESGVVSSIVPQLPEHTVLESFVGFGAGSWIVRLGKLVENDKEAPDAHGKVLGVATQPEPRMLEISSINGLPLRQIELGDSGTQPACESNGTFHLLTGGQGQERLQVLTATVR